MGMGALFNRVTGHKRRRLVPADEIKPLLKKFLDNPSYKFPYILKRVDDDYGGFLTTEWRAKRLLTRELATLWELHRYFKAIEGTVQRRGAYIGVCSPEAILEYGEALPAFEAAYNFAQARVAELKAHDRILGDMDLATKQIWIAIFSAIGSVGAAIAAAISAFVSIATASHPPQPTRPPVEVPVPRSAPHAPIEPRLIPL